LETVSIQGAMPRNSAPTLRQIYSRWVEDQIEDYKDSVSRSDLLRLADEAVDDLRVTGGGQYQITELLLCTAVDRKIFHLLKLPGFRTWARHRRAAADAGDIDLAEGDDAFPLPDFADESATDRPHAWAR
jgi:hypothetical protein